MPHGHKLGAELGGAHQAQEEAMEAAESDVLTTGQPPVEHNAAILNDLTKDVLTEKPMKKKSV